jgi:nitrous oxide reductase accessory protein NosL
MYTNAMPKLRQLVATIFLVALVAACQEASDSCDALGHEVERGEPGYSPELDGDSDGTACE